MNMCEHEVTPIWTVGSERQKPFCVETKLTAITTQRIKVEIKGFKSSHSEQLISPDLHFEQLDNSFWYLTVEPRAKAEPSPDNGDHSDHCDHSYVGVFLHLKSQRLERFGGQIVKFKIVINDSNRSKVWFKKSPTVFFNGGPGWGWKSFIKRSELFCHSHHLFDINILLEITSIKLKDLIEEPNRHLSCGDSGRKIDKFAFIHDLMNDKEFCDISCVVGDTDFALHSGLLAAKSSAFKCLIKKQKQFLVEDIDQIVFHELVLFLYNGFSPNIERYCKQLLIAANNWKICRLKSICDHLCFRDLRSEEAIDALLFADRQQTLSAKIRIICFIAINLDRVKTLLADNWQTFVMENEDLVKEIVAIEAMRCQCLQHQSITD